MFLEIGDLDRCETDFKVRLDQRFIGTRLPLPATPEALCLFQRANLHLRQRDLELVHPLRLCTVKIRLFFTLGYQ